MLKVTVKHYLNNRLKPVIINNINKYPVYVRVTYARKNHKIKSLWIFHELSEIEFENDLQVKRLKDYESVLISDIILNDKNPDDINISSRLGYTIKTVSSCFMGWILDPEDIKQELIKYISDKTNLSIEIFEMHVKPTELYYEYYVELAESKIFNNNTANKLLYFALLLKFETLYYPDNKNRFTPGETCNYFEWNKPDTKKMFIEFAKQENLLSLDEINNISKTFENQLTKWRSNDIFQ